MKQVVRDLAGTEGIKREEEKVCWLSNDMIYHDLNSWLILEHFNRFVNVNI